MKLAAPKQRPQSYHIVTYGCQMNDNDSEIMGGILESRGMTRTEDDQSADVIIVNTCVVREGAEERAVRRLENLAALKRQDPSRIVAVSGCMAQKDGEALLGRIPVADLVVGTRDLFKIGNLIDEHLRTGERLVSVEDVDKPVFLDAQPVRRKHNIKAFTTIMYGCNNFCAFCIVPKTRGRESSRPVAEIVAEVRALVDQGYQEVMLLGQNVNSYYHNGRDFSDLLAAVNDISGLARIRFITSHPKDCGEKLADAMASLDKVCENIHLPVQAGSNRILRRMKRFYSKNEYLEKIAMLRERMPDITITTDLICGFCDETDDDFDETYDLLERARWDSAFIFMYSPRAGTKAEQWIDSVPQELKQHRVARSIARQEQISGEINQTYVGREVEVLVEGLSKRSDLEVIGRTRGDKCVVFEAPESSIGQLMRVRVTEAFPHTLFGERLI